MAIISTSKYLYLDFNFKLFSFIIFFNLKTETFLVDT